MGVEGSGQGGRSSGCISCLRWLMIIVNVLIAAGAVAAVIIGLIKRNDVEQRMRRLCSSCGSLYIVYMSFFGALLGVSALGFFAVCSRHICLRVPYFICLLVLFVAVLVICILYTLLMTNKISMESSWNGMLKKKDAELCDTEVQLKCSGWRELCRDGRPADKCPTCTDEQKRVIDSFTETCESVYLRLFKSLAKMVLPVGFTVLLILLIGMIVTCAVGR